MLKRDVEMIARIIRANAGNRRKLAEAFALELSQYVSAFDKRRFLKACGVRLPKSEWTLAHLKEGR